MPWQSLSAHLGSDRGGLGYRGSQLREILRTCMGDRPENLPALAPPAPAPSLRTVRITHRARQALLDAAQEVLDGLLAKEPERLEPHLAPRVTTLWADGALCVHERAPLIQALEAAPGDAAPVILRDARTYLPGELRSVRPRGEAELLSAATEHASVAVTVALDSRRGRRGRAMVWAALDGDRWQIHTLALPSPDDVVAVGKRTSAAEDEAVRVADRIVRHWMLGHASQLKAMRNHMMGHVWVEHGLNTAEALVAQRSERSLPPEATWLVFLGTEVQRDANPKAVLAPNHARDLERRAKEAFKRPWDRLKPRWTKTEVGLWNAEARAVADHAEVISLLLANEDRDARGEVRERWRLAGLFNLDPR